MFVLPRRESKSGAKVLLFLELAKEIVKKMPLKPLNRLNTYK